MKNLIDTANASLSCLILAFSVLLFLPLLEAVDSQTLVNKLHGGRNPFGYPLDLKIYPGQLTNDEVMLCCHGYGSNSSLANIIASSQVLPGTVHLVGFNFPDYEITTRKLAPSQVTYGTINEILPAIYLLKRIVIDAQVDKVSLYGFSSGGAAVVNIIVVLNTSHNNESLKSIGVTIEDKQKILAALQRGVILLDAPLKSMDEYNAAHPKYAKDPYNVQQTKRYRENGMNPIDAVTNWRGLNLSVVLFLQNPDEAVSNRDDALFMERIRNANPEGRNLLLTGNEGGHLGFHTSLWNGYLQLSSSSK